MNAKCLAALGFLSFTVVASEIPELVAPQGVGVNIHFTREHEQDLDLIAASGCKYIRMDFGWAGTERQTGVYDWSAYDELTTNLERRGLRAIYILDYSNPLYEETAVTKNPVSGREQRDTASPQHPESAAAFARWAAASGRHFRGRPIIWEIWNEPNITFWKPKPDVQQYITLARLTCQAIREVEPRATIVAPATSGFPWTFLEAFLASGILEHLDGVSVHPYRNYSQSPETAGADYQKLRSLLRRYGLPLGRMDIPILSGEWGYASHAKGVSLETQAAYLVRQQLANLYFGVPLSIWYDWKNDGSDPQEREHNFGTVTPELQPKPAYLALQTFTRQLSGYRVTQRLPAGQDRDWVLLCRNEEGQQKLAAWTGGEPHRFALTWPGPFPGPITAVRSNGETCEVTSGEGRLELELTSAPLFVPLGRK